MAKATVTEREFCSYPGHFLREYSTNDRTSDGTDGPHHGDDAYELPALPERCEVSDDNVGQCLDAASTNSLNGASNEKGCKAIGESSDYGSGSEEGECGEEHGLPTEHLGEGGEAWLKDCRRKEK